MNKKDILKLLKVIKVLAIIPFLYQTAVVIHHELTNDILCFSSSVGAAAIYPLGFIIISFIPSFKTYFSFSYRVFNLTTLAGSLLYQSKRLHFIPQIDIMNFLFCLICVALLCLTVGFILGKFQNKKQYEKSKRPNKGTGS